MKKIQIISIWMMILIIMTPIVYPETETFTLFASVPTATSDNKITITGTTKANIDVEIILNKARVAELTSDNDGNFQTSAITLVREDNEIIIKATDKTGNTRTLLYNVKIDITPPMITYASIPPGSQTRSLAITGTASEPVTIDWRTSNITAYKSVQASESFSFNIDLEDGLNKLELIAKDAAGNTDTQYYEIAYDIVSPEFLSNNLDGLDNCYLDWHMPIAAQKKIDIVGQTNEKTTILVYIDHETTPQKIRTTDNNGQFRVKDVQLKGTRATAKTNLSTTTLELGDQYSYHIRVSAKDLAGNEKSIEKTITCDVCGGGSAGYTLNTVSAMQAMMPAMLLPKMLIQGIETITIPFNISYTGLNKAVIRNILVTPVIMGPEYSQDYDNDKIEAYVIQQPSRDRTNAQGIIQIKINKFDPLGAEEPDATMYRKEYNVSRHRYGECALQLGLGKDLNYGCMRFFLMLEVQYQEETEMAYLDPNLQTTGLTRENKVQKICFSNIEAPIDRITEQFMPKKMVQKTIKNIDHVLKKIEPVQEYLDTATEYATYTCIGSTAMLALAKLAELTTCQIGEWISTLGEAAWHSEIAEAGICDLVYHEDFDEGIDGNERARNSCKACSGITGFRKWIEYEVMHRACDRVGCPAAKTFKAYIKDRAGEVKDIWPIIKSHIDKAKDISTDKIKQKILRDHGTPQDNPLTTPQVFVGNDCAFTIKPKYISTTYDDVGQARGIKNLYLYSTVPEQRDYCTKYLRAAKPECCGIMYDREWGSACGVGKTFGVNPFLLDTFDELKESTCYAARQAGDASASGTGIDCSGGQLWNALAGFCEANTGDASSEVVYTGMYYSPKKPDSDDNKVYVFVKSRMNAKDETEGYSIYRGYAVHKVKYSKEKNPKSDELTESLYEVYDSQDFSEIFNEKDSEATQIKKLGDLLCAKSEGSSIENCDSTKVKQTYNRIKEIIGEPDKEYIVRADSGLLRAIQCICFPAVKAWIDQWVKILTMLRNCLSTVEIGKGDAGICDQFISQAVCDRIYDLLKCFSSKVGWAGPGTRVREFGIGSIVSILTNTASEMGKTMEGRYGGSSMWNALFNEKQLVHGICMWAFTGKYDLNIQQIVQHTTEEIAIDSQIFISECKKYFRGYNPSTNPSGLTTWAYECGIAMVAGADLNYQVKLQCSDDYRCADKDGYRNNECDCVKIGEQSITVERGTMKKGDTFNKVFLWPIQAGPAGSKYRYDTAKLYYEWVDPKTNDKRSDEATRYIYQSGSEPFGFCAFDPFTVAFRCQTGKQEGGISIKKITPSYGELKHPTKDTSVFFMDTPFQFEFQIKQSMPQDPSKLDEAKKYLYYRIEDQAGNTVKEIEPATEAPLWTFETNGDYGEIIEIQLDPATIQKHLDKRPGEKPIAARITDTKREIIDASDYVSEAEAMKQFNSTDLILVLESDGITVYKARSRTGTTFNKGDIIIDKTSSNYPGTFPFSQGEYSGSIQIEQTPQPGETIEIYIPKIDLLRQTPWDSKDPADWKITFTLYDADKYGQVTEQITTSPEGTLQKRDLKFKVAGLNAPTEKEKKEPKHKLKENDYAIDKLPRRIISIKNIAQDKITIKEWALFSREETKDLSYADNLIKLSPGDIWPTLDGNKINFIDLDATDHKKIKIIWVTHPEKQGETESISIDLLDFEKKRTEITS